MLAKVRQQFRRLRYVVPHALAEIAKGVDEPTVMSCKESVMLLFHSFPSLRLVAAI
jgi:hypothetical protein